jgi:hypothetical protein
MANGRKDQRVIVVDTIWGVELRIVLTPDQARDLVFLKKYGPVPDAIYDELSRALGIHLRDMAWRLAGGLVPVIAPPGGEVASGPTHQPQG